MDVRTSSPLITARANETSVDVRAWGHVIVSVRLDSGVTEVGEDGCYSRVEMSAPSVGSRTDASGLPTMIAAYAEAARFATLLATTIGREAYPKNREDRFDVRTLLEPVEVVSSVFEMAAP